MSSVIVQMLPSVTLEPALMALQEFVPQCCAEGQALELWVPALSHRNLHSSWTPSVFHSLCPELGVQLLQPRLPPTPLLTLPGPDPPQGLWASGREGPWGRQGQNMSMETLQDMQQQVWGLALPGMLWAPTCSRALRRELLPELGWLFWTSRILVSITVIPSTSVSLKSGCLKQICELSCKLLLFPLHCQSREY